MSVVRTVRAGYPAAAGIAAAERSEVGPGTVVHVRQAAAAGRTGDRRDPTGAHRRAIVLTLVWLQHRETPPGRGGTHF